MSTRTKQNAGSMGAHAPLQDRAEKNARLLLALWMEEGLIEPLAYPIAELPTEPIKGLANLIQDSLKRGRKGYAEIIEDNPEYVARLAEVAGELSEVIARDLRMNIHTIKAELHQFHVLKTKQFLAWKLQAALDRGEGDSEIVKQIAAIENQPSVKIQHLLADRAFNHAERPEKPTPLFSLHSVPICTAGNISNIQAPAKAGKSAALESMIASVIKPAWQQADTLSFAAENPKEKALIHFDTEQSRFDADSLIRRAMRRADVEEPPAWFYSYSLADLSIPERKECLRYSMATASAKHGGIFAVMIDGIGDLCADPNDSEESFALVAELHTLAIQHDCTIITVLHENPGSEAGKTRGHLGSQLERKAETNLRLAKGVDGITTVWFDRARHGHLSREQGACFAWSAEHHMHRSCGNAKEIKQTAKRNKMETEAHMSFENKEGLSYNELSALIEEHLFIKERAAKERVKTWLQAGIITKDAAGKYSLNEP
jgi:hypothetical protein